MIACDWSDPGAHRYTGTASAAIHAFASIPRATQDRLVAAWERREFADVLVIDRDSIRGQHGEYRPEIRSMHFGSAGKVCDTVSRDKWAPEHVETALAVCADGVCVAVPAICSNWFILEAIPVDRPQALAVLPPDALPTELLPGSGPAVPEAGAPVAVTPLDAPPAAPWAPWQTPFVPDGPPVYGPPASIPCPPVTPIPEPATWALMAAGLALLARARR